MRGVVKKRVLHVDGNIFSIPHSSPLLDTTKYHIEFDNGVTDIITANIIVGNILLQVDEEGHKHLMLQEIIDHCTTGDQITKDQGYIVTVG